MLNAGETIDCQISDAAMDELIAAEEERARVFSRRTIICDLAALSFDEHFTGSHSILQFQEGALQQVNAHHSWLAARSASVRG
jgi:hypothetical protein